MGDDSSERPRDIPQEKKDQRSNTQIKAKDQTPNLSSLCAALNMLQRDRYAQSVNHSSPISQLDVLHMILYSPRHHREH
jgi:hypothetical protein